MHTVKEPYERPRCPAAETPIAAAHVARFQIDKRYLAPVLVTMVLVAGQMSFGFLESWSRTVLAIATAIAVEMILGRVFTGKWPHLASAYVSGISVGMLVRSPEYWPYALCSAISITSKYLIRVDGRHIFNPSNLGMVAMLVLASDTVAGLSVQWGNNLLPHAGGVVLRRRHHRERSAASTSRFTYVASFLLFSVLRSAVTGHPWLSEVAPITGPMYQLFIFFMITDPKTTVRSKRGAGARRVPRRRGRSGASADAVRPRAVLRALPRRTDGEPDRDCTRPACAACRRGHCHQCAGLSTSARCATLNGDLVNLLLVDANAFSRL